METKLKEKFSKILFTPGDIVIIKQYENVPENKYGVVQSIHPDGKVWVTNMNMPFQGDVSDNFVPNQLRLRK